MPKLIGTWNPTRGLWETGAIDLLSEHSEPFWETWPTSGMTRSGHAYSLPTQVRPTNANVSSSSRDLLPTPTVVDMGRGKTVHEWDEWTGKMQQKHGNGNGHGPSLEIEAQRSLLPTPTTAAGTGGNARRGGARSDELLLPGVAREAAVDGWGKYEPALTLWAAIIGRPAPEPVVPGVRGSHRLNPALTEWMMGLDEGHIVDAPGITDDQARKAAGNGVVPQQAALAIRSILDGWVS